MSIPSSVSIFLSVGMSVMPLYAASPAFVYESADVLPKVMMDGQQVKIHTQGLHVTDDFYLVTGRLESKPKRALLLRFAREDLSRYEWFDITPDDEKLPRGVPGATLDHPGGFDVDTEGNLYVPVSTSHAKGPSLVYRLRLLPDAPSSQLDKQLILVVDDHIGALFVDPKDRSLVGANWDTKHVYRWTKAGKLQSKQARSSLFSHDPHWQLAVQDWKGTPEGWVIAGGIDKSQARKPDASRAVIQALDLKQRKVVWFRRLPDLKNVTRAVTNEGLCLHRNQLYLLPEDIGRGAKVLRYRMQGE